MKPIDDLPAIVSRHNNDSPKQIYLGRFVTLDFAIKVDAHGFLVRVEEGRVAAVLPLAPPDDQPVFTFAAPDAAWETFSQALPPRGFQDIMAMVECRHATLTGDILPVLVNMFFIKGIVEGVRVWRAMP